MVVEELDEESLGSQAAKYVDTEVLVQMHGAALGNVFFLPRGAVYVDVVPENNEDKHGWATYMMADYEALQVRYCRGTAGGGVLLPGYCWALHG